MTSEIFETHQVWKSITFTLFTFFILCGCISGCSELDNPTTTAGSDTTARSDEEFSREYSLSETYNETRKGIQLILDYDAESKSFKGTVKNTRKYIKDVTNAFVRTISGNVRLSNGTEIPFSEYYSYTTIGGFKGLAPGEKTSIYIRLPAGSTNFSGWRVHFTVSIEDDEL